jgi:hypothetical protein
MCFLSGFHSQRDLVHALAVVRGIDASGAGFRVCVRTAKLDAQRLKRLRKNSRYVIPKDGVCPRNLLFLGSREEKQISRFTRDDGKYFFRRL